MKNQYVGDINDYAKYIVLEKLSSVGLGLGVCWMLTENNGKADGGRVSYLNNPTYRMHSPVIYDALKSIVSNDHRNVREIEVANIIPSALFYDQLITLGNNEPIDLIFLDPDNGFEVKSIVRGKAGSERYVFWGDVASIYDRGYSVMVYQHFPRVNRVNYMDSLSFKVFRNIGVKVVFHIHTNTIDFVIILQIKHHKLIERAIGELRDNDKGLVKVNEVEL